jgi:uncharacterized protein (DUF1015 family)
MPASVTKIKPFRAVIYNQEKVKNLASMVCPPYDVISSQEQEHYHDLSPYNLIHILLGKDIPGEDKYQRAADYFRGWLKDAILIQDEKPSIYFYSQEYNFRGEKRMRLGFISLLRLGEENSAVFGHEHTRLEPKEDRFKLIKQVKANLSPIFVIFPDKKRIIQRTYRRHIQGKPPFIDITDDNKIIHKLWRIDAPEIIESMQSSMSGENIFIADGHHRYEVACAYRDEMMRNAGEVSNAEGSLNYIEAYFTNTDSRGLAILPVHRLLKSDSPMDTKGFLKSIGEYFDVEEVRGKTQFFFLLEKAGLTEHLLGMYKDRRYWLLRLRNIGILDKMLGDKPKVYRTLDICILNHIILKKILGVDLENKEVLQFSPDADEFIEAVDNNPAYTAFFLNPVKVQQIIAVALDGERFPAKSTYFYPKVLSGLVINKLE